MLAPSLGLAPATKWLGPVASRLSKFAPGEFVEPSRFSSWHINYKIWLGRQDSNLGMPESKSGALPLGYAPVI